jgi:hypothetical protein
MKSAAAIAQAYKEAQGRAGTNYKAAISATPNDVWKAGAIESQARYVERVTSPETHARRLAAIQKTDDWQKASIEKGAANIARGMAYGEQKRTANYEPVRQKLEGLQLPPKTTDPYTNLTNRAGAVIRAMRQAVGKE